MSLFKFERSALRRIGLSLFGEEAKVPELRGPDGPEDQSDPYLSQAARLLTGAKVQASSTDPNEVY